MSLNEQLENHYLDLYQEFSKKDLDHCLLILKHYDQELTGINKRDFNFLLQHIHLDDNLYSLLEAEDPSYWDELDIEFDCLP